MDHLDPAHGSAPSARRPDARIGRPIHPVARSGGRGEGGAEHVSEAHTPGTMELAQVQEGSITVTVGGQSFTLDTGDAMSFTGDVDHSYANPGTRPARFSLAVYEPGVGTSTRQESHNG